MPGDQLAGLRAGNSGPEHCHRHVPSIYTIAGNNSMGRR
jgi:hypothetical protein